jgi:hypothetical protein
MQTQSKWFGVIFIQKARLESLTKHVATVFLSKKDKRKMYIFLFASERLLHDRLSS